jgi:shikimate kinase
MGSGKTSVGRQLAARLGLAFRDSDAYLEAETGLTARAFQERWGATALHEWEWEHLRAALASPPPGVIAAAASIVEHPASAATFAASGADVLWLRARPETLARRHPRDSHRPGFDTDAEDAYAVQGACRGPLYALLADAVIDVDDTTVDAAVAACLDALQGLRLDARRQRA